MIADACSGRTYKRVVLRREIAIVLRDGPKTARGIGAVIGADLTSVEAELRKMYASGLLERDEQDGWQTRGAKQCRYVWRLAATNR